jgi:hypothetical protein
MINNKQVKNKVKSNLNDKENDTVELKVIELEANNLGHCNVEPCYYPDDVKERNKYILFIERLIRNSFEMKAYLKFLKNELDMSKCSFFNNVEKGSSRSSKVNIELHHAPFSLFDIVSIVLTKYENESPGNYNPHFEVAKEVLKLHYENMVGLIPLSKTVHDLVHNFELFIPSSYVFGNFPKFINEYEEYFSEELKETLKNNLEMSTAVIEKNSKILEQKFTLINVDGFTMPKLITKEEYKMA